MTPKSKNDAMPPHTDLRLVPITRAEARRFIAQHHRHAKPPAVAICQVGVAKDEQLVGVALVARPLARKLCDGTTAEISRIATDGTPNACSMLYAACARAAKALGYQRILTYTLESEPGASLRASSFVQDDGFYGSDNPARWETQRTPRSQAHDLFGTPTMPTQRKRRWWRTL